MNGWTHAWLAPRESNAARRTVLVVSAATGVAVAMSGLAPELTATASLLVVALLVGTAQQALP